MIVPIEQFIYVGTRFYAKAKLAIARLKSKIVPLNTLATCAEKAKSCNRNKKESKHRYGTFVVNYIG